MSTGLIVVLLLLLGPYLLMNAVRLARGKAWAVTYCTVLKEADLRQQADRRAARERAAAGGGAAARG